MNVKKVFARQLSTISQHSERYERPRKRTITVWRKHSTQVVTFAIGAGRDRRAAARTNQGEALSDAATCQVGWVASEASLNIHQDALQDHGGCRRGQRGGRH
ncbi:MULTISPECIES: hypothetical protein [unclassified Xanthomonas]|uniref:hypothetical protein n=1 Tax=Xanthomonas sp. LMG 9002 TaxID=1591158 RepID=UPI00136C318C|nr:hypothetical protein [Xanthomonas sp. LMG 9002]